MLNRSDKQVIAPLLITLRVAGRSALTSEAIVSGSLHFESQGGSAGGSDTLSEGDPTSPAETNEETSREHGIRTEDTPGTAQLL